MEREVKLGHNKLQLVVQELESKIASLEKSSKEIFDELEQLNSDVIKEFADEQNRLELILLLINYMNTLV